MSANSVPTTTPRPQKTPVALATTTGGAVVAAAAPAPTVPQVAATTAPAVPPQQAAAATSQNIVVNNITYRFPLDKTMRTAVKLSIQNDKPIMMDYWTFSLDKKIYVGINANKERYLIKSLDEYTSMVIKLYNIEGQDLISETENSIYIVANGIGTKKIDG